MKHTPFPHSDPVSAQLLFHSNSSGSSGRLPQSLPIPTDEAALGIQRIGKYQVGFGAYSDVWKAEMTRDGLRMTVALKVLRLTVSKERLVKREEREKTSILLKHDNVAPLYAMYRQPNGSPVFVSQWYKNGTADEYLRSHPDVNPMIIIYEIASGMEYLHGQGVIHGDLKGSNVLIDDGGHARLNDFGLSRRIDKPGLTTCTPTSLRWCAPELLRSDDARTTMRSDVYAFASTALELLIGAPPYAQLGDRAVYQNILAGTAPRHLTGRVRFDLPDSVSLWRILEFCWKQPQFRPIMTQVKRSLRSISM